MTKEEREIKHSEEVMQLISQARSEGRRIQSVEVPLNGLFEIMNERDDYSKKYESLKELFTKLRPWLVRCSTHLGEVDGPSVAPYSIRIGAGITIDSYLIATFRDLPELLLESIEDLWAKLALTIWEYQKGDSSYEPVPPLKIPRSLSKNVLDLLNSIEKGENHGTE